VFVDKTMMQRKTKEKDGEKKENEKKVVKLREIHTDMLEREVLLLM